MSVLHIVTGSASALDGGMEASVLRIAGHLHRPPLHRVVVHALTAPERPAATAAPFPVHDLWAARDALIAPTDPRGPRIEAERRRADGLLLCEAIRRHMAEAPAERHAVLSFYAISLGHVAHLVARELHLRHVAAVRGTDLNRGPYDPLRMAALAHVLREADVVAVTNERHRALVRDFFHRTQGVVLVPNGLLGPLPPVLERPRRATEIHVVSDVGYSQKKATHVLIDAVRRLRTRGLPIRLTVVGATEESERAYWERLRSDAPALAPVVTPGGFASPAEVEALLADGDLYASTSLGEGAAAGHMRALVVGLPVVATAVGHLPDIAAGVSHVRLAPAGDAAAFEETLSVACRDILEGRLVVDGAAVARFRELASPDREARAWAGAVAPVLGPSAGARSARGQPRVLFFVHDGLGLGHLRRVSRLAAAVQGPCASLLVSSQRAAAWILPETCELVHVPWLDSLLPSRARLLPHEGFWRADASTALEFRTRLVESVFEAFDPDAVVVDYFPLGRHGELGRALARSRARKYSLLRGVLDEPDLTPAARHALGSLYDRVLVACDRRVVDMAEAYRLDPRVVDRLAYLGYVAPERSADACEEDRRRRGLPAGMPWVVCSSGSGHAGRALMEACAQLATEMSDVAFDVVDGPRAPNAPGAPVTPPNLRRVREDRDLATHHMAADVVVTGGGYNSLVEALAGRARIVCWPLVKRPTDEKQVHASRLVRHGSVRIVHDLPGLRAAIAASVEEARKQGPAVTDLDLGGVERFRSLLLADLDHPGAASGLA